MTLARSRHIEVGSRRLWGSSAFAALALAAIAGPATPAMAQRVATRPDGIYALRAPRTGPAAGHSGTLAVRRLKGGVAFDLSTVSSKGTTCAASGVALGGSVLSFRDGQNGFRLTIDARSAPTRIVVGGLPGRVSETKFCGLGASLTGLYVRTGDLDPTTVATLATAAKAAAR